ncbi:MAG TPA: hypothetical protein DD727_06490, partial [Clostridiales bacterium]|nr:hypothetical protein [Clostridiales bacterium]
MLKKRFRSIGAATIIFLMLISLSLPGCKKTTEEQTATAAKSKAASVSTAAGAKTTAKTTATAKTGGSTGDQGSNTEED